MNVRTCSLKRALVLLASISALAILHPASATAEGETVCIDCHDMQTGRGKVPVQPWRESIHAKNGISCHNCHGGDPKDRGNAMNPARGFLGAPKETAIPSFCGRCHVGIMGDYLQSAHGKALGKGGPTCVTCHGSHGIQAASLELINDKSCSRCHTYDRAAKMKAAMQETEAAIALSDRQIRQFRGMGIDTEAFEKALFSTRNSYRRLFHDVDAVKVVAESKRIKGELDRINGSLAGISETIRKRKTAGVIVVGISLLLALLLYLLRRTYD